MNQQLRDEQKDYTQTFKFDDSVIAGLLQLLQLSFLTGTDITQHLQSVELEPSTTQHADYPRLKMTSRFIESTDVFVQSMMKQLEQFELNVDDDDTIRS